MHITHLRKVGGQPENRPRYRLEQLLKECNPEAPPGKADLEWLKGRRAGRELI
jgi:hypothetical protein